MIKHDENIQFMTVFENLSPCSSILLPFLLRQAFHWERRGSLRYTPEASNLLRLPCGISQTHHLKSSRQRHQRQQNGPNYPSPEYRRCGRPSHCFHLSSNHPRGRLLLDFSIGRSNGEGNLRSKGIDSDLESRCETIFVEAVVRPCSGEGDISFVLDAGKLSLRFDTLQRERNVSNDGD